MRKILKICVKEFNSFFSTPAAWLFLGCFLVVNLFVFFWGEAFFARNIADMKPLFQWMPVLLIFLVAALTMRSWSEERRSGTMESLLTSPVSPLQLVLGKFTAAIVLVALALLLTFPIAVTVSFIGNLDWGPVAGGYVASMFLASAYIAIGLYMSCRTDNPIVALIMTVAASGILYLVGSPVLTTLFGHRTGGLMEMLGSGARFDSITRGVLDLRDIYYYLSIVGVFLSLNLYTIERLRWAGNRSCPHHSQVRWVTALTLLNFVLVNIWLNSVGWARVDLTQGRIYSLSETTRQYMQRLSEPLIVRGYFSSRSHPLLEPLVPQIKDMLKEYQEAGGEQVRVEFVDPHTDQSLEQEAAEKYGIRPVPFRMASRYQAGVVNSYFDLLVSYGDQYETLSFEDLIEVKSQDSGEPEILLKNPEYEITSAIRKVTGAYQAGGNLFAGIRHPLTFHGYISGDSRLPEELVELRRELEDIMAELKHDAGEKLELVFEDPDGDGGKLAMELKEEYGFEAQIASLFDPRPFWFYMVLKGEHETVQVPLPGELNREELKNSIKAAVQRMAPGYLKTVAMVVPSSPSQFNPYMPAPGGKRYGALRELLTENARVLETDLKDGRVPAEADLLLLMAPEDFDERQLFAVDQFLMQGGSVVAVTSSFDVEISNTLSAVQHTSGLEEWLGFHGLSLDKTMVLDPHNGSLPIPVQRNLGMLTINEIQMMPYPHFPDIRGEALNQDNPMTSGLGQLTINWASPISIDHEKNRQRQVDNLMYSSKFSWTSDSLGVVPDYGRYPDYGFAVGEQDGARLLAVAVTGGFDSYFKGRESPLLAKMGRNGEESAEIDAQESVSEEDDNEKNVISGLIERSSDSARIILVASNTFACDAVISLASQGQGSHYLNPLEFLQNSIDWALDDHGLLGIRSRAQFARMLIPMQQQTRVFWEYLNYGLALLGLGIIWLWRYYRRRKKAAHYRQVLVEV